MNPKYSEAELVEEFLTKSPLPYHKSHERFVGAYVPEVRMTQGRPDLVISSPLQPLSNEGLDGRMVSALLSPRNCSVLGGLTAQQFSSAENLSSKWGLNRVLVSRTLSQLVETGLVEESSDKYRLSACASSNLSNLWAIEFKLTDWKRALYQAIRYRSSAQRVTVIMPRRDLLSSPRVTLSYSKYNIGLSLFDPETRSLKSVVRTKSMKPYSMRNYFYALGQYLNGCNSN